MKSNRGAMTARFDFSAAEEAYRKLGAKGARNLIRRAMTKALAPVRAEQKSAWRKAKFARKGRKLTRKAIVKAIALKRGKTKGRRGSRPLDGAAVGIDYKAGGSGPKRQRVAHIIERGARDVGGSHRLSGTKRLLRKVSRLLGGGGQIKPRWISRKVNERMAGPVGEAFAAAVRKGIQDANHD